MLLESFQRTSSPVADLKRLDAAKGLRGRCTTLLGANEYSMLQVEAPSVPAEELAQAVRWKVKDMLEYPVESATLDLLRIPIDTIAPGRPPALFAVVARNETLLPKIRLFQEAKVGVTVIDIPELALRNVAALFETENRGLVMLNFGSGGGMLIFTFRGELYVTRRIEITLEQLEAADEARRSELFDRIALEVQRSVDNFERLYNVIALSRLIVPDLPGVPGLIDYLKGYLSLAVEPMDLAEVMDFPAIPELRNVRRQAECLEAIGAALRSDPAGAA